MDLSRPWSFLDFVDSRRNSENKKNNFIYLAINKMVTCTIYKIISPNTQDVYVGSTKLKLNTRFSIHKSAYNKSSSRSIIDSGDAKVECLEVADFPDRRSAFNKEKEYIDKLRGEGAVIINKNIPCRTQKEWYQFNRDRLKENYQKNKEKYKQYYIANRDYLINKQKEYYRKQKQK
jgi:hypothetical protein